MLECVSGSSVALAFFLTLTLLSPGLWFGGTQNNSEYVFQLICVDHDNEIRGSIAYVDSP